MAASSSGSSDTSAAGTSTASSSGGVTRDVNGRVWVKGQRKPRSRRMIRARSRGGVVAQQQQQSLPLDASLQDGVLTVYSECPNMDPRMSMSMSFSGSVSRMGSMDAKACGDSPLWAVYPLSPPPPPPLPVPVGEDKSSSIGSENGEDDDGKRKDLESAEVATP